MLPVEVFWDQGRVDDRLALDAGEDVEFRVQHDPEPFQIVVLDRKLVPAQ